MDNANAQFHTTELGARWTYLGAFAQDDFKVSQKLTLNFGVRWEVQNPFTDVLDRFSYMDPTIANPGAGQPAGRLHVRRELWRRNWHSLGNTVLEEYRHHASASRTISLRTG